MTDQGSTHGATVTVYIPAALRSHCGGQVEVALPHGKNVRQVVAELERRFPGVAARLTADDELATGLAVSVDGVMSTRGLATKVAPGSEIHFLPALGGG